LYAQIGALTYACDKALELLISVDLDSHEANRIVGLLELVLRDYKK
jgi:hypothetical protein